MQIDFKNIKRFIPIIRRFNKGKGNLILNFGIKINKTPLKEEDEANKYLYVEYTVSKDFLNKSVINICLEFTTFGYNITFGKYKVFGKDIRDIKNQINKLPTW